MSTINGGEPLCMLGWLVAILITIHDGMVWAELRASMPGTGGSYVYLREGFGRGKWGHLMAFLFIWQFMLSGPPEFATAYMGFVQYLSFIWPDMTPLQSNCGNCGRRPRHFSPLPESWNDVVIPGLDYVVVENSCGKFGARPEEFNALPKNVHRLVGHGLGD